MTFLTVVIALLGLYIAYQQWRTNWLRLKHDLYDKRYQSYRYIAGFIADILTSGQVEEKSDIEFLRNTREVVFLFNNEIRMWTQEIYQKTVLLDALQKDQNSLHGDELRRNVERQTETINWFKSELNSINEKFIRYLSLEEISPIRNTLKLIKNKSPFRLPNSEK